MREIKLTQGKVALVDDEDYEYLNQWRWYAKKTYHTAIERWYAHRSVHIGKKCIGLKMHRVIMSTPKGLQVDHKDHNGLNNQKSNLRNCTRAENGMNTTAHGESKYLGVHIHTSRYKDRAYSYYGATIKVNGRKLWIGQHKDEIECAKMYDKAAIKYFGEFANPNFK